MENSPQFLAIMAAGALMTVVILQHRAVRESSTAPDLKVRDFSKQALAPEQNASHPAIPNEEKTTFSDESSRIAATSIPDSIKDSRMPEVQAAPPSRQNPQLSRAWQPANSEPIVPEPLARAALDYVGYDPDAEALWMQAINDPSLSADARQNLIEDLNESGLSDPDHPTQDDLPLIESRLELIEQIGPDAMDDVNGRAFTEAYNDLMDMEAKLMKEQSNSTP